MLYKNSVGTGQDLVLLHGWGFNSALFNALVAKHKHHYRITLIDLPGHGRSQTVEGGLEQWSDEIISLLPSNPILLGWSLGGLLAIDIARKVQLSKLVLVASSPKFVQALNWEFGIDKKHFGQFSNALQLDLSTGLKRFVSLQSSNRAHLRTLHTYIDRYPAQQSALNQGLTILLNTNLVGVLKQLSVPVDVVLGKRDTLVPNKIAKWYQQNNMQVTLLNTGHLPFLHPDFNV